MGSDVKRHPGTGELVILSNEENHMLYVPDTPMIVRFFYLFHFSFF